jgi:hypothetical protein
MTAPACQRAAYHYQPLPAAPTTGPTAAGPQLLFLSFRMSTTATGAHQVEPLLVKAVPGQPNPAADDEEPTSASYVLISQLDAAGQPCGPARRVPHPLQQDVEAPGAPGTGTMQRHTITLPQAEFFVRLARQPQARAVRLEEAGPAAPQPISVTFPLPN